MSFSKLETISTNNFFHSMKDQLQRLIYTNSEKAFSTGDSDRDKITDAGTLQQRQKFIRKEFIASLGGLPTMDTPLEAEVTGIIQEKGFRIEKVVYQSRPKSFVTANLYVPDGIKKPTGAVLFLCGHYPQAKHFQEYQIVCRHLVQAGLVVLAQDPIGQGERFSYYERALKDTTVPCCWTEHDYAGAQCSLLGHSIARYFLHDSMRGIDYLSSRPEVDAVRIGVTGNSGGGTQTSMMMMGDLRIAAAAPVTFIMNRRTYMYGGGAQDAEQIWPGLTSLGIDHEDILLAMCPKPVCILAVKYDFFPIEGTRRTVERCRRFWRMFNCSQNFDLTEDTSLHLYTPVLACAAARFFSKHLLGEECPVNSESVQAIEPSRLWCTNSGQTKAEHDDARFAFEENQSVLAALGKERKQLQRSSEYKYKKRALKWLKGRIEFNRQPVELNLRFALQERENELSVEMCFWWSQGMILNEGLLFRNYRYSDQKIPVTLAIWNDGTKCLKSHSQWIRRTCASGRAVFVLNTTGVGGSEPNPLNSTPANEPLGVFHKYNDDLIWLNDSICAMRSYDVLRCLEALRQHTGVSSEDVRVYAHGTHSIYAELAAAIEPSLARIELHEEFTSFSNWVKARYYNTADSRTLVLPGVLKYFDLPDLRKWRAS